MNPLDADDILARCNYERSMQFREYIDKMPFLNFPPKWEVSIIPPFAGAMVRFRARLKGHGKTGPWVSVYFDAHENLGYCGGPHWEIYPNKDGESERFLLGEEKQMLEAIGISLSRQSREKKK